MDLIDFAEVTDLAHDLGGGEAVPLIADHAVDHQRAVCEYLCPRLLRPRFRGSGHANSWVKEKTPFPPAEWRKGGLAPLGFFLQRLGYAICADLSRVARATCRAWIQ